MTTPILGMTLPAVNGDADAWGALLNTAMTRVDTALTPATRQILTTGSSATYTTPANVRQLRVRMWAGGGGGGGWNGTNNSGSGGTTSFGSTTAIGGTGGNSGHPSPGAGGAGGTGGSNTGATSPIRIAGQKGQSGLYNAGGTAQGVVASGGATPGSAGHNGDGSAGYGGGGCGAAAFNGSSGGSATTAGGGGGGGGEFVEFLINSPSGTYTYTVGAGGVPSSSASVNGLAGVPGAIFVEEIY